MDSGLFLLISLQPIKLQQLAIYHHTTLGSPAPSTLLHAIRHGHLTTFPGLTTQLSSIHWDNYIYHFQAEAQCPLSYIHRAHTEVTNEVRDAEYEDLDNHLVNNIALEGQHFAILYNKRKYAEFKSYISARPGWTFIKHFDAKKDGCGVVLAFKKQCKGKSANMTIKAKAYAKLGASQFTGHQHIWTFQHYVQAHQEAHAELELVGKAVPTLRSQRS
jgi:hypothetical protein